MIIDKHAPHNSLHILVDTPLKLNINMRFLSRLGCHINMLNTLVQDRLSSGM